MTEQNLLEKIVSLCKRRGFVYPSSEIYGGLAGIYDYGPLGVELSRNIKDLWWHDTVYQRDDMYGLDGSILMHPKAWEASGHVAGFTDPLIDCKDCKRRVRPDKLKGWQLKKDNKSGQWEILKIGSLQCPECGGELIPKVRQFNILMETSLGVLEGEKTKAYLKGESCQNIYLDYINVIDSFSPKIPFGIAQIGKAFRNEMTYGKFLFKTREFEQFDVEYFVKPEEAKKYYEKWKKIRWDWYVKRVGVKEKNLRWRRHSEDERIFYARDAWDIDYCYPWGWDELEGVHDRSDYDLTQQGKFSGKNLDYVDEETRERFIPNIVECSGGVGRTTFVVLLDAYCEDKDRVVLKLKPSLAPYKVAVFPLLANKPELVKTAREVFEMLRNPAEENPSGSSVNPTGWGIGGILPIAWDDRGNIGKRYYAQDEIGTPWCVTVDFQTLEDGTVTVRDRDTTEQERVATSNLKNYFSEKLASDF